MRPSHLHVHLRWPWRLTSSGFKRDPGCLPHQPDLVWVFWDDEMQMWRVSFDPAEGTPSITVPHGYSTPEEAIADADKKWPVNVQQK